MPRCWRFTFCPTAPAWLDFSDEIRTSIPSGIQTSELGGGSILRTLESQCAAGADA